MKFYVIKVFGFFLLSSLNDIFYIFFDYSKKILMIIFVEELNFDCSYKLILY